MFINMNVTDFKHKRTYNVKDCISLTNSSLTELLNPNLLSAMFKASPFFVRTQDLDFLEAEELSFFSKEKDLEEVIHLLKQTSITDVCSEYRIGESLLHKIQMQFLNPS